MISGPLLGLYVLGMFFRCANSSVSIPLIPTTAHVGSFIVILTTAIYLTIVQEVLNKIYEM